jgi:hypothetical protein
VEIEAKLSGADVTAYAMATISTLSGVIDHQMKLKPKQHDKYSVSPNLWIMIIAPPSARKTAVMDDVRDAIRRLDGRDWKAYQETKEAEKAKMAEAAAKEIKKITPPRRRVLVDTTSEALCDLLSKQNCGAILVKDELSGWFGGMDKYGGKGKGSAQDRSIWVKAFDGGQYVQQRVSVEDRWVNNLSVAVIGAIQPERLKEMGRLDTDGLLQRFIPVMMADAKDYLDEPHDPGIERRFTALIDGLDGMPPMPFLLSDWGRAHFSRFTSAMTKAGKITDPSPAFGGFLAKLPRALGAITLILHLVDVVEGRYGRTDNVSDVALRRAERIIREFVIPHALAFYDAQTGGQALTQTKQIAVAIIKHEGPTITLRDLVRGPRTLRGMAREEIQKLLFPFEAGGWLTPVEPGPWNAGWRVTPGLKERFAAEHEAAVRLQAEIRSKIAGDKP